MECCIKKAMNHLLENIEIFWTEITGEICGIDHFVLHVNENSKCELYAKNNGLKTC